MKRACPIAKGGGSVSPEIARLVVAIARDLAREDHERELAAYNRRPVLASPITVRAD
jgi:hypothetical protein